MQAQDVRRVRRRDAPGTQVQRLRQGAVLQRGVSEAALATAQRAVQASTAGGCGGSASGPLGIACLACLLACLKLCFLSQLGCMAVQSFQSAKLVKEALSGGGGEWGRHQTPGSAIIGPKQELAAAS